MKKLPFFIVLLCASLVSMAQDVIVKIDGSTIQSKVMEINGTEIKYKKWSNQEGPIYSINKNEVDYINYQNGEVELITSENNTTQPLWLINGKMERDGRDFIINGHELSDEEVCLLVGEENCRTYLKARKQIRVGRTFTPIFWVSFGFTVILAAAREEAAVLPGSVAAVSLPMMLIYKNIGKEKMDRIADEYNKNGSESAFSYKISPSIMQCNSVESQSNLGLGLTFIMNF